MYQTFIMMIVRIRKERDGGRGKSESQAAKPLSGSVTIGWATASMSLGPGCRQGRLLILRRCGYPIEQRLLSTTLLLQPLIEARDKMCSPGNKTNGSSQDRLYPYIHHLTPTYSSSVNMSAFTYDLCMIFGLRHEIIACHWIVVLIFNLYDIDQGVYVFG